MKRNLLSKLIAAMLVCVVFASCSSIKWVSVDRLVPAEVDLSERVRRIAVLNNQPNMEDDEISGEFFFNSKAVVDTLAQYLADAAYFDEVVVGDTVLPDDVTHYYRGRKLRPTTVAKLCETFGVDMLVTVDNISFQPYGVNFPFVRGQVWLSVTCYENMAMEPIATIQKHYTFDRELWHELKSEVVRLAALWALPTIVPQWQMEEFPFYTGANVGQRDAAVYVREGNWDGAAALWRQQLNHKNRRRRMEAHLNMAVYHELKDEDVAVARTYAEKALELSKKGKKGKDESTYDGHLISDYVKDMERRGRNLERVKQQMRRFSNDF